MTENSFLRGWGKSRPLAVFSFLEDNKMSKLFLHVAKTGSSKTSTPISLAIVSDTGKQFYAEFSDYSQAQIDAKLKDKIIRYTIAGGYKEDEKYIENYHYGLKKNIKEALENWLMQFTDDVQIIIDKDVYDFVFFVDMFGSIDDLPDNVISVPHDMIIDIASKKSITEIEAIDLDLDDLVTEYSVTISVTKGDALYNALAYKRIYDAVTA